MTRANYPAVADRESRANTDSIAGTTSPGDSSVSGAITPTTQSTKVCS